MKNTPITSCAYRLGACFWLLSLSVFTSCEFIRIKEKEYADETRTPVVRVYDAYLYTDELNGIVAKNISKEDSIMWVTAYIDKWVKNQLFLNEAIKKIDIDQTEIEKKVLDYRNSLIEYQFRKLYIKQNIIDSVSNADIEMYYNDNRHNFTLKRDVIKGTYIKISKNTPQTNRLKTLIHATDEKSRHDLKTYCISFSALYYLSDLNWVEFDKLILDSPLVEITDKVLFLQKYRYYETKDTEFLYFLKIDNYKLKGDASPLEFVAEDIKNIIINKRKMQLARQQEKEIYENAVEKKIFESYTK